MIKNTMVTLAAAAALSIAQHANATVISYVGNQSNVETFTNDPTVGWRNAGTAKLFDIDGDNIIGTDGYDFAGSSTIVSLPSYVASSVVAGAHNDNNRGLVDNPLDASGADIGIGWSGNAGASGNFATIAFQGTDLAAPNVTLRLGILYDSNWSLAWGTQTFTLTQTVGGSDSATTPTLALAGDGVDVANFDLAGIQDGDTFVLSFTDVSINWAQIGGVTFDTWEIIPEPSTLFLLGAGVGVLMIARLRKKSS